MAMRAMNKDHRIQLAKMVGELADIAAARDIDTALSILTQVCDAMGIDTANVPQWSKLDREIFELNTKRGW